MKIQERLVEHGFMIPEAKLQHGVYYVGVCRNANIARWNAHDKQFYHWREKFGRVFVETTDLWDPQGTFDGFVPLFILTALPKEIPLPEPTRQCGE